MNSKSKGQSLPVISSSGLAFIFQSIVDIKIYQDN